MFTVIVTLDIHQDGINQFTELIDQNARNSVEHEPGCISFDVIRSIEIPNRFFLYEIYRDEAAFQLDHKGSDHFAEFVVRSTPLVVPGSKTEVYGTRISEWNHHHDTSRV